jgi:hypothetical protein
MLLFFLVGGVRRSNWIYDAPHSYGQDLEYNSDPENRLEQDPWCVDPNWSNMRYYDTNLANWKRSYEIVLLTCVCLSGEELQTFVIAHCAFMAFFLHVRHVCQRSYLSIPGQQGVEDWQLQRQWDHANDVRRKTIAESEFGKR